MPMLRSPESPYVQERAKWESIPTLDCPLALKPYEFKPYPAMFYKASRPPMGGSQILFEEHEVQSDTEASNMRSRGWGSGQAEAFQMLQDREQALAVGAAERNFSDRNMSAKAKAEADAYEHSTPEHVAEIPRTPVKRGRPKKVEA